MDLPSLELLAGPKERWTVNFSAHSILFPSWLPNRSSRIYIEAGQGLVSSFLETHSI